MFKRKAVRDIYRKLGRRPEYWIGLLTGMLGITAGVTINEMGVVLLLGEDWALWLRLTFRLANLGASLAVFFAVMWVLPPWLLNAFLHQDGFDEWAEENAQESP